MTARSHGSVALSVLACGALAWALRANVGWASHVDPRNPSEVIVGPSPGIAPMGGIDAARRGRAQAPLPDRPSILWRVPPQGTFDLASIAVDASGAIVAASASRRVTQVSRDGKVQWRAPTGEGPSIGGVVLLNDETRAVVTSASEVLGYSPSGALRFRTALDLAERTARVSLLPLDEGGATIAAAREVVRVDSDGHLRDRIRLPERIAGPLLATRAGIVATGQTGTAYVIDAGFAKNLGSFGGDPGEAGASTADGWTIVAVIDGQRIVALDLRTGAPRTLHSVGDQSLHGPVVFGRADELVLITFAGTLLEIGPAGHRRTALDPRAESLLTDSGKVDLAALEDSPPPISDAEGRVAFARVGGRIGVVSRDGSVSAVRAPCPSPAALAPAGARRLVAACRDGSILMFGEQSP
jgi:hypothetical protein